MIEFDHSLRYDHAAGTVFAALADVAGYPNWQPNMLSAEVIGNAGIGPGALVRQLLKVMGRQIEINLTVTTFQPDEVLALNSAQGAHPAISQTYRLHPDGNGCRLDFHLTIDGVPRMAEHLVRPQLSRQVPQMFDRLGAQLSAQTQA